MTGNPYRIMMNWKHYQHCDLHHINMTLRIFSFFIEPWRVAELGGDTRLEVITSGAFNSEEFERLTSLELALVLLATELEPYAL